MSPTTRMLVAALALLASGCTIIPGLHVKVDDPAPKRTFRIGTPDDNPEARALPYRVTTLTPDVVQALATSSRRAPDFVPTARLLSAENDYLIGAGDVLAVTVWDHPELTNPSGGLSPDPITSGRLVRSDGTIFYPYIGAVVAKDRTTSDIQKEITEKLKGAVVRPQVDVRVSAFRSKRVQVSGEVNNPGVVNLDDLPRTILDAVNERGGLKSTASRRRAYLTHGDTTVDVNLTSAQGGSGTAFQHLEAGDVVFIPDASSDQVFMLGEVTKVAPVVMQQGRLSLTEALTIAGGLDKLTANDAGVLIFRRAEAGEADQRPVIYALDMSHAQGLLLAGEFDLQPRDVVYVKATQFAQYNLIIGQLLPTISSIFQIDRLVTGR